MSALDNLGGRSQPGGTSAIDRLGSRPLSTPSGQPTDTSTVDGLYALAQAHGGAVATAANELVHPHTSILSTVGDGFKKAFSGFIDTISLPSEVIAGAIDPKMSIADAIKTHERVSDVVFGKRNPNATTVQKVGDFFVRTATDILTDPLTYLTFGGSAGIFGLKALPEVSLGIKASEATGVIKAGDPLTEVVTKAVSEPGSDVLKYAQLLVKQSKGQLGLDAALAKYAARTGEAGVAISKELRDVVANVTKDKLGTTALDFEGQAYKDLMKATLDSPMNIDFAKRAFTNLLENNPGLTSTLLDKGGIKFFGKSVVSGQRIGSVLKLVPGMTAIDQATAPTRMALGALFNPAIIKTAGGYQRIPEEMVTFMNAAKDFKEVSGIDALKTMSNLLNENAVTAPELSQVMTAISTRKLPSDPKLANIYMRMMDLNESSRKFVEARGGHIGTMENHVGLVLNPTETKKVSYAGKASGKIGASETAQNAKFIAQDGQDVTTKLPTLASSLENMPGGSSLIAKINEAKSVQDVGFAMGNHLDELIRSLTDGGLSMEQAFANKDVQELIKLREQVNTMPQSEQFIGRAETHGLKPTESDQFFTNNEGTIFKRVATNAQELKDVGIEGFDTNLATSMATRFLQNINQGVSLEFVDNLGKSFGMPASIAPQGWVPLAITKANEAAGAVMGAAGEQILYHPTIAAAAEDMFKSLSTDPATGDFLKFYDKLQAYWKGSVTSIFPQFHGRNAVSNVLLNFLDLGYHAFNPATHTAAIDLLNKNHEADKLAKAMMGSGANSVVAREKYAELMNKKVFTDAQGASYTFGEMRSAIKQHGVAFNGNLTGQIDVYGERERMFTSLSDYAGGKVLGKEVGPKTLRAVQAINPFTLDPGKFVPLKVGRDVGNLIENQARLVNFISNLRATGDVIHAAQRTKMFLFDYQNLSNFERSTLRRIIPFYTFTRKNLELQVKTLMTTPGRIAGEVTALTSLGDTLSGQSGLTDAEKAALPDWVKSGIGVLAERKGSTVNILTGFGTPIEQPFQAFQPNQLLGSISPLIRLPVEQASGYSFFQGKMLSDVTNASAFKHAPRALQELVGYTELNGKKSDGTPFQWEVSMNPEMMNLVLNMPFGGRVLSALKQLDTADISTQYRVMQQIVGVRPYSFDVVQEQQKRQNELRNQLSEMLTKAGVTATFSKTYIPKAQ